MSEDAPLSKKIKPTARTIAKLFTPRMLAGFKLHYVEGQPSSYDIIMVTHNADQILIPHFLDRYVVHETRNNCSWTSLLAKVNLLIEHTFIMINLYFGETAYLDI
jgi:hypothetical protein